MARLVRPWKPCSKQTTPCLPVQYRATLTAFSTASAPLLRKNVRFSWSPGVPRCAPVPPCRQLDVGLVGGNREADVGKPVELLPHRLNHPGMAVAGVDHRDSAPQADQTDAIGLGGHRNVRGA